MTKRYTPLTFTVFRKVQKECFLIMKKSKLLKSLGFASLAVFMGATALFTFAPLSNTPIVASGLNASASTEGETFDLGLRPDTDPVVYVTESGLEIKKSNGKYSSLTTLKDNRNNAYTQDITSFYYFTMGTFSGTIYTATTQTATMTVSNEPVNWLIIGRGTLNLFETSTPAGSSVYNDFEKQEYYVNDTLPVCMADIPWKSEIPDKCFLVISEKLLGQSYLNSKGALNYTFNSDNYAYLVMGNGYYGNRYRYIGNKNTTTVGAQTWTTSGNAGGSLYNYINNLFSKDNSTGVITGSNKLGFTQAQADMIVPQQLYTYYSNGSGYNYAETPSTDENTYYTLFPLAVRSTYSSTKQNYCIEDYLTTSATRISSYIGSNLAHYWWTRSGLSGQNSQNGMAVPANGNEAGSLFCFNSVGVRPAFVIKVSY